MNFSLESSIYTAIETATSHKYSSQQQNLPFAEVALSHTDNMRKIEPLTEIKSFREKQIPRQEKYVFNKNTRTTIIGTPACNTLYALPLPIKPEVP